MRTQFLFTILVIFALVFSTVKLVSASNTNQDSVSYFQVEQLHPDFIVPTPSKPLNNPIQIDPNISFIKSPEGTKGFRFSISGKLIDFGELSPTNPIIRNNTLLMINTTGVGYTIFPEQDHQLKNIEGATLPDTSCDNGACTSLVASIWDNTLSFGFGYRCDNRIGTDCNDDFFSALVYKRFPLIKQYREYEAIINGAEFAEEKEAVITYKVNTSAAQPPGSYTNTVTYLAVPGY